MGTLQQIVVQETTSESRRSLAQYGEGVVPSRQVDIFYEELTPTEKKIWDDFIELVKSK
jgi:hypothetical protein